MTRSLTAEGARAVADMLTVDVSGDTAVEAIVLDRDGDGTASDNDVMISLLDPTQSAIAALDDGAGGGQIALDDSGINSIVIS